MAEDALTPPDARKMTSTPMHPHALLVERFYTSFQRRDPDGMAGCCHRDVTFSDPIFPLLRGDRARAMWHMLLGRAASLEAASKKLDAFMAAA